MTKKKAAPSSSSQFSDLLSTLAAAKGDLSRITAPPFILAPKSAIETSCCWAARHSLFLQPSSEPDPARRALLVAKNYICSFKQLVDGGSENEAKKPLNPFLGELFLGEFRSEDGSATSLIAEQVSHHPPVTACAIYNKEHGISSEGFVAHEISFSIISGVTVRQAGYAITKDENHDERHLMTMPTIHIKGLATGQPYPELEGPCYISSSSGFITKVELETANKLGMGGNNRVTATIFQSSNMKQPIYHVAGQWDGDITIKDARKNILEKFHVDNVSLTPLSVRPLNKQTPWESRRAWSRVTEAIEQGDMDELIEQKTAIEESQRRRREEEKQTNTEWNRLFFRRQLSQSEEVVRKNLITAIPDCGLDYFGTDKTDGVWKFIGGEEAQKLLGRLSFDTSVI